ncbi:unnamed protein product [[Candida] boidinii]|nr:unnamed protein product [[Candida] boidinii]
MSTDSTVHGSGAKINDYDTSANNVNPEVVANENSNNDDNDTTRNIDTYEGFFRTAFVKDFHPVWTAAYMSTGIAACVLFGFPYEATWLRICGLIMWGISLILFLAVNWLFIHKALVYKTWLKTVLTEPSLNVFLAPYSMGFSTTVNMIHLVTVHYKHDFAIGTMVFWWINALLAVLISWTRSIDYFHITKQEFTINNNGNLIFIMVKFSLDWFIVYWYSILETLNIGFASQNVDFDFIYSYWIIMPWCVVYFVKRFKYRKLFNLIYRYSR